MAFIKNFCISLFLCFKKLSFKVVSFAFIALSVFIVGLLGMQLVLNQPLIQKKLSQKLADWSGGDLSFSGKIKISYFPQVSLKAEHVFLRDVRRLPHIDKMRARSVTANFEWWPLLIGKLNVGELRLQEPEIYLSQADGLSRPVKELEKLEKRYIKRILKTVQNIPFTEMHFDNALLVVPNNKETGRDLYKFTAHLSKEGENGKFSGRGYFNFRDKKVHLAGFSGATQASLSQGVIPLDVTFNNAFFKSHFVGTLNISGEKSFIGIAGIKDLESPKVARWFGLDVKDIDYFSKFSLSGDFKWTKKQFEFKKARLIVGRHQAKGSFSVHYNKKKPRVSGNLVFSQLNLKSETDEKSFFEDVLFGKQEQKKIPEKTFADVFDADIRFFADKMKIDKIVLSSVVATLLVRNSNPQIYLADAQVFGGRVYGSLKQERSVGRVQHRLNLSLKNIQSEKLVALFLNKPVLSGRSDIHMSFVALGNNRAELFSNIDGKIIMASVSGGHIGLDFSQLFRDNVRVSHGNVIRVKTNSKNEWLGILNKKTRFEHMTAKLVFHKGTLKSNRVRINERGYLVSILGQANLAQKRIRWLFDRKIVHNMMANSMKSVNYGINATRRVVTLVEGKLENPSIKRQYIGINAAPADMKLFPVAVAVRP